MIITIGREHGSNGHEIAKKLAETLGYTCYDKEIVDKAAEQSAFSKEVFHSYDEKKVSSYVTAGPNLGILSEGFRLSTQVASAQFRAIRELAENDNCIFVGRCADYILREKENVVTVFINADDDFRVRTLAERYSLTEDRAKKLMKEVDKDRASYYRYYTDQVWGGAKYYDICVNSAKVGIDGAAEVIRDYVENIK